jgi:ABC-2 type transport system permease protein
MRAFRSEFIRIWRPAYFYGGFGAMAAFAALISVFIYTAANTGPPVPGPASGQAAGFASVAQIASPGGFLAPLTVLSRPAGVIVLSLWAMAVATDYSTGLIRIVVQAYSRRVRLLTGKIAALAAFTVIAATIAYLVMVFCARPLARLEGIDVEHWKTDFASHFFKGYLDFTVAMLVWGLIGLLLAVLTRSSAIAIGIGIGFLLVVESLIMIVAANAAKYLPGGTLTTLVQGGTDGFSWGAAAGVVVLYGVIAAGVSLLVFRSRDIVA